VTLWQPDHGGHVGFGASRQARPQPLSGQVGQWLLAQLPGCGRTATDTEVRFLHG